jgi:hypothetical protein
VSQGIGQTTFAPSTANPDTFAYGLGQATIDLADWAQYPQVERVTASVGAGELVISVPQGWDVTVLAKVGLGAITRDGATVVDGQDITQRLVFDSPTPSARTLTVDASVNVGQITTVTVAEGALS